MLYDWRGVGVSFTHMINQNIHCCTIILQRLLAYNYQSIKSHSLSLNYRNPSICTVKKCNFDVKNERKKDKGTTRTRIQVLPFSACSPTDETSASATICSDIDTSDIN